MIKFLIAIVFSASLVAQQTDYVWYPSNKGGTSCNNFMTLSIGDDAHGKVSTIIDNLPVGLYRYFAIRNSFKMLNENSFATTTWDLELSISRDTVSAANMIDYNSHNMADYRVLISKKNISLPSVTSRFPNGGLDALIADHVSIEIPFDYPFNNYQQSNVCIMFDTATKMHPYHFFDVEIAVSNMGILDGARSIFRDSNCFVSQGTVNENMGIRRVNGNLMLLCQLMSEDYSDYFITLSQTATQYPTTLIYDEVRCNSYIDYPSAVVYNTNELNLPIPEAIIPYHSYLAAQAMAFSETVPPYVGPTWILACPQLLTQPLESRTMANFMLNGPDMWAQLFILLKK